MLRHSDGDGLGVNDPWVNYMLGFFRIGEQFLNGFQQSGPLRLGFGREIKNKRFKCPFGILYVCLQGILFCGAIEAAPSIPNNIRSESKDCRQMVVMVLEDDSRRGLTAGSKAEQSVIEGGSECGASDGNSAGVVVAPSDVAAETGKQDGSKDGVGIGEERFNHFQYWLIVIIALLPIFLANNGPYGGMKPNGLAQATRRLSDIQ